MTIPTDSSAARRAWQPELAEGAGAALWRRAGLDVTIMLNAPCNYSCEYCCAEKLVGIWERRRFADFLAPLYLEFLDAFEAPNKVVRVNAYGELSLVPGIWEFLGALSGRAKVMLATNLTFELSRLYQALPPESVLFILSTLHPETEVELDVFTGKCRELISRGYDVLVHCVVDNDGVARAEHYRRQMQEWGITFFLSPMQGVQHGVHYPQQFTTSTRDYLENRIEELHPQLLLRYETLAFTGLTCSAGHDRFSIRDTTVSACMNSDVLLGVLDGAFAPLPAPSPCLATHANSQCLPDRFLPNCRTYCMGNHRLTSSVAAVQPHLDLFERIYTDVVTPSLQARHVDIRHQIGEALGRVEGPIVLALFGLPLWPYLNMVRDFATLEVIAIKCKAAHEVDGIPVSSPDHLDALTSGKSAVVVLYSIHGYREATAFIAKQSDTVVVIGDLPAELPYSQGNLLQERK